MKQSANVDTPIPLPSIYEQSNANSSASSTTTSKHVASLIPPPAIDDTINPPTDADSFDERISEIPPEVMSPTDTLKTGGFGIFFEYDPDDFGRMLSQLDTEKQERRASWESGH